MSIASVFIVQSSNRSARTQRAAAPRVSPFFCCAMRKAIEESSTDLRPLTPDLRFQSLGLGVLLRVAAARGGRPKRLLYCGEQARAVEAARYPPALDEGYVARLFADDDRDGVCVFGDADGRAVSRAEVFRDHAVERERQKARGGRDAVAADDDRAVMQRRFGVEYRDEQVVGEFGVHLHAALYDIAQGDAALDDDECAGLRRGERRRGEHYLVVDALAELPSVTGEKRHAEAVAKVYERL